MQALTGGSPMDMGGAPAVIHFGGDPEVNTLMFSHASDNLSCKGHSTNAGHFHLSTVDAAFSVFAWERCQRSCQCTWHEQKSQRLESHGQLCSVCALGSRSSGMHLGLDCHEPTWNFSPQIHELVHVYASM